MIDLLVFNKNIPTNALRRSGRRDMLRINRMPEFGDVIEYKVSPAYWSPKELSRQDFIIIRADITESEAISLMERDITRVGDFQKNELWRGRMRKLVLSGLGIQPLTRTQSIINVQPQDLRNVIHQKVLIASVNDILPARTQGR